MEKLVKKLATLTEAKFKVENLCGDIHDAHLVKLTKGKMPVYLAGSTGGFAEIMKLTVLVDKFDEAITAVRHEIIANLLATGETEMLGDGWTVKLIDIYFNEHHKASLEKFLPDFDSSILEGIQRVVVRIDGKNI